MRRKSLSLLVLAVLLHGCATTDISTTGDRVPQPYCQSQGEQLSALILWGPVWRPNQKDVPQREEAAQAGLEDFAKTSGCFTRTDIRRLAGGRNAELPTNAEVTALVATVLPPPDKVLVVTVHELGPVIQILGPIAAFGGGTEVVLVVESRSPRSGDVLARTETRWSNGGSFVLKGTSTLPQDMRSALQAALTSGAPSP
jgi:hypothetical protein